MELLEFAICDSCDINEDIGEAGNRCSNCEDGEMKRCVVVMCDDLDEYRKVKITTEAALGL